MLFPPMPLEAWADTKATLHRFAQIVGKIRLASSVRRNHWWNVPFHLTGRGITTRPMGNDPIFTIDFDFVDHRLLAHAITGETRLRSKQPVARNSLITLSRRSHGAPQRSAT